jgi:ankyrin repeat protein
LEVNNCIKIYQEAGQLRLERLTSACADFISASWNLFEPEHFEEMKAELLFDLLKRLVSFIDVNNSNYYTFWFSHCNHIVHATIRLKRSDVMLLFLSQHEGSVEERVNEADEVDNRPLDLALNSRLFETAKILCDHGADVNRIDNRGKAFIAKAIEAGNVQACEFLVENGAQINYVNETTGETTLIHTLAKSSAVQNDIEEWSKRNIHLFDLNKRDKNGRLVALVVFIVIWERNIFKSQ